MNARPRSRFVTCIDFVRTVTHFCLNALHGVDQGGSGRGCGLLDGRKGPPHISGSGPPIAACHGLCVTFSRSGTIKARHVGTDADALLVSNPLADALVSNPLFSIRPTLTRMLAIACLALSVFINLAQAQVDSTRTLTLAKRFIGNEFTSGFGQFIEYLHYLANCSEDFFTKADPTGAIDPVF